MWVLLLCYESRNVINYFNTFLNGGQMLYSWHKPNLVVVYFYFPLFLTFKNCLCLFAPARTSSTVLSRSGEQGHPCLVSELKGELFSLSPLSMTLTVFFGGCSNQARKFSCIFTEKFFVDGYWIFVKFFPYAN